MTNQPKPIICTFHQLAFSLQSLHHWQKSHVDTLHDCWLKGAPVPQSRILNPKNYDPRKVQHGNYEARIILPALLKKWVTERASALGIQMTGDNALELLNRVRIAFDGDIGELIQKAQ